MKESVKWNEIYETNTKIHKEQDEMETVVKVAGVCEKKNKKKGEAKHTRSNLET